MLSLLVGCVLAPASSLHARDVVVLDDNWRFFKGDVVGADQPNFNDLRWPTIHVPHDWSIAGPFAETNVTGAGGAFLPAGVAWYRTDFALPSSALNQRVSLEFDGVMGACDVWINGMHLGHQTNGSAGFRYEVSTARLAFGSGPNNVLSVCADTSDPPATGWYTGAGLCRTVRLIIADPVHIAPNGISVSVPKISGSEALVSIATTVTNESPDPHAISLQTSIFSPDGDVAGAVESSQTIPPAATVLVDQQIVFPEPQPWTPETPALSHAVAKLRVDGRLADLETSTFAVRAVQPDGEQGILLNGKPLSLRAVTLFPDGGAFGAAAPASLWANRLRTLKMLGVNAVSLQGGDTAPRLAALCDRLGLLDLAEFPDFVAPAKDTLDLGIDYLGGASGWPGIGHAGGLLDRTGAIRPLGRVRQSQWQKTHIVTVFRNAVPGDGAPAATGSGMDLVSDWTPASLTPHAEKVVVYSNCQAVELYLNGKSLGEKKGDADGMVREWTVPFAAGMLKAVAREGGRTVGTNELRTAGKPVRIVLTIEQNKLTPVWDDVAIVRAAVVDAKGVTVPSADDLIVFKVTGPGQIAAVDNADNASHEPFAATSRPAYQGRCLAYLRATQPKGKITVIATAAGLKSDSVTLLAVPAKLP